MAMVAEDALERAWEGVRKWSNMVFDKVEKRKITWADKQEIKDMRYATSWFQSGKVVKTQVPCDAFNVEGKECTLPDEHCDDKYIYCHRCAACWYALPQYDCKHSMQQCKRKKACRITIMMCRPTSPNTMTVGPHTTAGVSPPLKI